MKVIRDLINYQEATIFVGPIVFDSVAVGTLLPNVSTYLRFCMVSFPCRLPYLHSLSSLQSFPFLYTPLQSQKMMVTLTHSVRLIIEPSSFIAILRVLDFHSYSIASGIPLLI